MCQRFENKIEEDPDFLDVVWFSNNRVYLCAEDPGEVLQRPLNSAKCTAWVAITKHGIIGPFWFETVDEVAVTVIKERNIDVLNKFWRALGTHGENRFSMVPTRWGNSIYSQHHDGVVRPLIA